jgi:transcriptional regulator with XRE-family HTH domain
MLGSVGGHERLVDRATRRGEAALVAVLAELHHARLDRGLSTSEVGAALGLAHSSISRIERGRVADPGIVELSRLLAVVGLELSVKVYPADAVLRDAGHARLLGRLRPRVHVAVRWVSEASFPNPGDLRAWDALLIGRGWRCGVEAEMAPRDAQALARRLEIKQRDGAVDHVILLLPRTRRTTAFLAAAGTLLLPNFPVDGRRALALLAQGLDPGGNAIIVL